MISLREGASVHNGQWSLRYPDVGVPGGADVGVTRVREETKLMWPTMPSKEFFVPSRPRWARLNPH